MKKKSVILTFSVFLGIFLLQRFCESQTGGFSRQKISSSFRYNPNWEASYAHPSHEIFNQPFYYLGRGAQTFVFLSKDRQYVIKFFRHRRTDYIFRKLGILLPPPLKEKLLHTLQKRKEKLFRDFSSYKLAYDELKNETGILYLHLNKTNNLHQNLTLYDKIGVQHSLPLDSMEFIVQRKAQLVYPTLEKWIREGNFDVAKEALSQLVSLLRARCKKGIYDKDPDLKTNFGFIDTDAIQIDPGRFKKDPTRTDPEIYKRDLIRITDRLCGWLDAKAPALSEHIRREIAK